MNFKLVSRADAYDAKQPKYFTGLPCKRGHVAQRWVSNTGCCDCMRKFVMARTSSGSEQIMPLLWKARTTDPMQIAALTAYLQDCVKAFDRQNGLVIEDSLYTEIHPRIY